MPPPSPTSHPTDSTLRSITHRSPRIPDTVAGKAYREAVLRLSRTLAHTLNAQGLSRSDPRGRHAALLDSSLHSRSAAQFLGISPNHLTLVLHGKDRPGLDLAQRLAAACGMRLERVLELEKLWKAVQADLREQEKAVQALEFSVKRRFRQYN